MLLTACLHDHVHLIQVLLVEVLRQRGQTGLCKSCLIQLSLRIPFCFCVASTCRAAKHVTMAGLILSEA